jgi:MFS family permease
MFDGLDATIFVLALFPALSELLRTTSHAQVGAYGGVVLATFMVGWGVGALVFGILADQIGRTRAMIITIFIYAIFTGMCALSHSWVELSFYRFLVGCGIGGEQSIGIVLIAEYWRGKARLHATSFMTTAFGCGYFLASILNAVLGNLGWRYLFLAGVIPALLTIYIRFQLRESAEFELAREFHRTLQAENGKRGRFDRVKATVKELFVRENTRKILTVATMGSTSIVGYWAVMSWVSPWINQLTGTLAVMERTYATMGLSIGTIISGFVAGWAVILIGRKNAIRFGFVGALLAFIGMFMTVKSYGPALLAWTLVVGFFAQLPFNCLFIYAPELFNTHIRGTAVGFSVQAGRVVGALLALISGQLIAMFGGSYPLAGSCVSLFYLVGIFATFFMPPSNGEIPMTAELAGAESDRSQQHAESIVRF